MFLEKQLDVSANLVLQQGRDSSWIICFLDRDDKQTTHVAAFIKLESILLEKHTSKLLHLLLFILYFIFIFCFIFIITHLLITLKIVNIVDYKDCLLACVLI